jgi:hypothetical protein
MAPAGVVVSRRQASRGHLTIWIIGTTLILLVSAQMPIRPLTCCREVDVKPPMQTAAATAEVDVRASA